MALTTEDIHAAADQLHANGITPTQTKVREALGGGSFSTIGEALKTWKQELQEHEQLRKTDMPDVVKDNGLLYIAQIWQTANQKANDDLSATREAYAKKNADNQAAVDDFKEALLTLEGEEAKTKEALNLSIEKAQKATIEAEALANEITSLNTFITDLNHKLDIEQERTVSAQSSLTATNDKLDSTRSQLDTANEQLTQARESIATYKATNNAQSADIERLQADAIEHKKAHQITTDKLTERTAERDDLAKQLAAVQGKLEAVTEQSEQLVIERKQMNENLKSLTVSVTVLENNNEQLTSDNKALSQTITKLQAEIKNLDNTKI